jgi:hypothetical protein
MTYVSSIAFPIFVVLFYRHPSMGTISYASDLIQMLTGVDTVKEKIPESPAIIFLIEATEVKYWK